MVRSSLQATLRCRDRLAAAGQGEVVHADRRQVGLQYPRPGEGSCRGMETVQSGGSPAIPSSEIRTWR